VLRKWGGREGGRTAIVPTAHAETDVEEGPLPELGGEVVLLVRVGDEGVVGRHHGDIQMDEVLEEGRLEGAWVSGRD
jgi:hypothetical protein